MNQIQSVVISEHGVQITYLPDNGVDRDTGIVEIITKEIPHGVIPTSLLEELVESVNQILDEARVAQRRPVESFQAPR